MLSLTDDTGALLTTASASAVSEIVTCGVSAAVGEMGLQMYRHNKYKNDFSHNTYDYKMDTAQSWSTMGVTTGVAGTLTLAFVTLPAWLVMSAAAGTFAFCWGMWWVGKKLFGKNEREKWYYEYNVDYKDLKSLQNGKQKLEDILKQENWHPDMFEECILTDKEKQKLCQKYIVLNQIIENIDIDIVYFEYNKQKTIENCKKGASKLRHLIKKERLHPDLFVSLNLTENEKQRRLLKWHTFMTKIQEMEEENNKKQQPNKKKVVKSIEYNPL